MNSHTPRQKLNFLEFMEVIVQFHSLILRCNNVEVAKKVWGALCGAYLETKFGDDPVAKNNEGVECPAMMKKAAQVYINHVEYLKGKYA